MQKEQPKVNSSAENATTGETFTKSVFITRDHDPTGRDFGLLFFLILILPLIIVLLIAAILACILFGCREGR